MLKESKMRCEICGAEMKPLLTNMYCPNEDNHSNGGGRRMIKILKGYEAELRGKVFIETDAPKEGDLHFEQYAEHLKIHDNVICFKYGFYMLFVWDLDTMADDEDIEFIFEKP